MSDSDRHLVTLARRGDRPAFERLVHRHLRAAYAVALSVLGEPADAEDACQDAFITALERLEDCRRPERFRAWLLTIVRNRARSLQRRSAVRRTLPLERAYAVAAPDGAARLAELSELRDRLRDALGTLSEVQRQVVVLHDLEGWRHREIAESLEMPVGTVRSHLHHARRALRRALGTERLGED